MPIPQPQKHAHSLGWPHPLRWNSPHSSVRNREDPPSNTWRTHGNRQVPKQSQTLCVLAWNPLRHQIPHWIMPNMPMSPPAGTMTATPPNTGLRMPTATPWCWLLPLWQIWIPSCHGLLFQDTHHQENPWISMQCLQDHLSPEGTLHRTWHHRGTLCWQWPQFANTLFTEFATGWKFDHNTSSPRNHRSNGQAEAAIKTVKGLLTHAKCSGQDPYLAVPAYHSTPVDVYLHLPTEMLYKQVLCTTVPQWIRHTNPHADAECDHLNQCTTQSVEYHDQQGCHKKPPFFAGQTISVLNDTRHMRLPATIISKANNGSYLVQVIGTGQYRCACDHIWEHHLDAVKPEPDTSNIGDVAPAASTSAPAIPAVRPPTAIAPTRPTPAAPAVILQTPCKALPAVCSPQ